MCALYFTSRLTLYYLPDLLLCGFKASTANRLCPVVLNYSFVYVLVHILGFVGNWTSSCNNQAFIISIYNCPWKIIILWIGFRGVHVENVRSYLGKSVCLYITLDCSDHKWTMNVNKRFDCFIKFKSCCFSFVVCNDEIYCVQMCHWKYAQHYWLK